MRTYGSTDPVIVGHHTDPADPLGGLRTRPNSRHITAAIDAARARRATRSPIPPPEATPPPPPQPKPKPAKVKATRKPAEVKAARKAAAARPAPAPITRTRITARGTIARIGRLPHDNQVPELYAAGYTQQQIATHYGVSISAIGLHLKKHGIPTRPRWWRPASPLPELAAYSEGPA